jgi:hypothetical protein
MAFPTTKDIELANPHFFAPTVLRFFSINRLSRRGFVVTAHSRKLIGESSIETQTHYFAMPELGLTLLPVLLGPDGQWGFLCEGERYIVDINKGVIISSDPCAHRSTQPASASTSPNL